MTTRTEADSFSSLRRISSTERTNTVPHPHFDEAGGTDDLRRESLPTADQASAAKPASPPMYRSDPGHTRPFSPVSHSGEQSRPKSVNVRDEETWIVSDLGSASEWFQHATIIVGPQWSTKPHAGLERTEAPAPSSPIVKMRIDQPAVGLHHSQLEAQQAIAPTQAGQSWPGPGLVDYRSANQTVHADRSLEEAAPPYDEEQHDEPIPGVEPSPDLPVAWEVDEWPWPEDCHKLYRMLGDELFDAGQQLRAAVDQGIRVMAITGSQRGEGRTTVAMLLARAAAQLKLRTVLIEADMENPHLARKLNIELPLDWRTAPARNVPFDESAVYALRDRLVIAPLIVHRGQSIAPSTDQTWHLLLGRWAMLAFDLVLIDLGRWHTACRWLPWDKATAIHGAILVRDMRNSSRADLDQLVQAIASEGIESIGIIENFVRPESE